MGPSPGQRCDYHRRIALNYIFTSPSSQSVVHRAKKIRKRFHVFFAYRKLTGIWPSAPATSVTRAAVTCCGLLATRCAAARGWGPKHRVWQLQIRHPAPHPGRFFTTHTTRERGALFLPLVWPAWGRRASSSSSPP